MKRVKRRYLAVSIESERTVSSSEFMAAFWEAVSRLYGEHGASRVGVSLIDYDMNKRLAVLRTGHDALEMTRVSLSSIVTISTKPAAVHVMGVSGTIKALSKKSRM